MRERFRVVEPDSTLAAEDFGRGDLSCRVRASRRGISRVDHAEGRRWRRPGRKPSARASRWAPLLLRIVTGLLAVALGLLAVAPARADERTDFLIRMLATSDQFRVRAQAALALGTRPNEASVQRALTGSLRDAHPAVRAASASSLERLQDPQALVALRPLQRDRDEAVRAAVERAITTLERSLIKPPDRGQEPATYYVAVGTPTAQSGLSGPTLRSLREHVVRYVDGLSGVRIAPEGEAQGAASTVLRSQHLVGYYLDSSITKIEEKPDGAVRAQVSVIVGTYPGRAMRVMLSGAATVSGAGSGEAAKVQAVEAAFTGALKRLPQAMEAGASRAE